MAIASRLMLTVAAQDISMHSPIGGDNMIISLSGITTHRIDNANVKVWYHNQYIGIVDAKTSLLSILQQVKCNK